MVLLTGFGNSEIYSPEQSRKIMHRSISTDSKMFVVVVNPLEYIRKQQVVNPKRAEKNVVLPLSVKSAELEREI